LGKRPELLKYTVQAPKAGKYRLTAHVATVARRQSCILRLNRRTLIDINLPFSLGMWEDTEPVTIDLREGRNTLMFTCRAPNRGVSIKEFALRFQAVAFGHDSWRKRALGTDGSFRCQG
jgi:hypothetical protein